MKISDIPVEIQLLIIRYLSAKECKDLILSSKLLSRLVVTEHCIYQIKSDFPFISWSILDHICRNSWKTSFSYSIDDLSDEELKGIGDIFWKYKDNYRMMQLLKSISIAIDAPCDIERLCLLYPAKISLLIRNTQDRMKLKADLLKCLKDQKIVVSSLGFFSYSFTQHVDIIDLYEFLLQQPFFRDNNFQIFKNDITVSDIRKIANMLLFRSRGIVDSLDLCGWFEADAFMDLIKFLKHPQCPIKNLDLSHNKIGDICARELSFLISGGESQLKQLRLDGNAITDHGLGHLIEAVSSSKCRLKYLSILYNDFGSESVQYVRKNFGNRVGGTLLKLR